MGPPAYQPEDEMQHHLLFLLPIVVIVTIKVKIIIKKR